jgi:hypothetical protein
VYKNIKVISNDYIFIRGSKFAKEAKFIIMQQLLGIQLSLKLRETSAQKILSVVEEYINKFPRNCHT